MRDHLVVALVCCVLSACVPRVAVPTGEVGNVEDVSASDPEMNAAIADAQETLPRFITSLSSPSPTQSGFVIKVRFPFDANQSEEHMWVTNITYDGSMFYGSLDNEPVYVTDLRIGDRLDILPEDVSDWVIYDGDRLLGGFTIHVLRSRMTEEERERFDADFGFLIGDQPALP